MSFLSLSPLLALNTDASDLYKICSKSPLFLYTATNAWFEKMKSEIPNYEKACGEGAAGFGGWFKAAKAKRDEK